MSNKKVHFYCSNGNRLAGFCGVFSYKMFFLKDLPFSIFNLYVFIHESNFIG
jgi:hypothetical protein